MSVEKTSDMNEPREQRALCARKWLIRAIKALGAGVFVAFAVGAALVIGIFSASGWRSPAGGGQVEIYSAEQIDRFITSVLITVQNAPLGSEDAFTDMVFVASYDAYLQKLTMAAFVSDLTVEPEGRGRMALGDVCAAGGPELLVNTMNEAFGLDLQYYACTDTASLARMIDVLGGIATKLDRDEAGYINDALYLGADTLKKGEVTLTGSEAMVHALDGLSGGDEFGATRRQLGLVSSAVVNMRKTATKSQMVPLLTLVFNSIRTNLDILTLSNIGYEILKADDMESASLTVPCEGSWSSATLSDVRAIEADLPRNAEYLRETLYRAQ